MQRVLSWIAAIVIMEAVAVSGSASTLAQTSSEAQAAVHEPVVVPVIHNRYVYVDGVRIFYREAGPVHGPVVFLPHGFPTSSHMFRNLIPVLADRYRVIAPDYPASA